MEFSDEEIKLIKGCILTTQQTLKCIPLKNKDIKEKLIQIDELLKKF